MSISVTDMRYQSCMRVVITGPGGDQRTKPQAARQQLVQYQRAVYMNRVERGKRLIIDVVFLRKEVIIQSSWPFCLEPM